MGNRSAVDVFGRFRRRATRLEQRFQVYQHGVLSAGDHVLAVNVRRLERVEHPQVCPLAFMESPQRLDRVAALGRDELHPPVRATVEDLQRPEGGMRSPVIDPGQELLKVRVGGE